MNQLNKLKEMIVKDIEDATAVGVSSDGYYTNKTFVAWNPSQEIIIRGQRKKVLAKNINSANFRWGGIDGFRTHVAFIINNRDGDCINGLAKLKQPKKQYDEYLESILDPRD